MSLYLWTALAGWLASLGAALLTAIVTPIDIVLSLVWPRRKGLDPKTIVITGATSGIGEALAKSYAKHGVKLLLTGRNEGRLAAVATECTALGASSISKALDVTDSAAMQAWLEAADREYPIDMVIANAGVSEATIDARKDPVKAARVLLPINITGVMNSVLPLIEPMKRRGRGTIVIMASLAGFGPITNSAAYSASKIAIKTWGEALRTELACTGVDVCVVCPGFVVSPMTTVNKFYMPGLIDMDACVAYIREGLANNAPVTAFPPSTFGLAQFAGALPPVVRDALGRWGVLSGLYFYRSKSSGSASAAGAAAKRA